MNTYEPPAPPPPVAVATMMENDWLPVALAVSVTVTVNVEVAAVVGVPLITPVVIVRPVGNEPLVTANVYGLVPPCAVIVSEYGVPTVPLFNSEATGTGLLAAMLDVDGAFTCWWPAPLNAMIGGPIEGPTIDTGIVSHTS
jgi:hypothetical protein